MAEDGFTSKSKPFQSRKKQQNAGKQTGGAGTYLADHTIKSAPKPRNPGPNSGGGRAGSGDVVTWHVTVHEESDAVDYGSLQSSAPKAKHQCHAATLELKVIMGNVIVVRVAGPPHCFGRVRKWLDEYLWTATGGEYAEQMPLPPGAPGE
eukprot:m.46596 g.46596  ORF g.46596 m.46596 type:complete len:150 (+) comp15459_c0_seq1:193-642(+)